MNNHEQPQMLYYLNEIVFAKCQNYKPWPGEIMKISMGKLKGSQQFQYIYKVHFLTTKTSSDHCEKELSKFTPQNCQMYRKMYKNTKNKEELAILKNIQLGQQKLREKELKYSSKHLQIIEKKVSSKQKNNSSQKKIKSKQKLESLTKKQQQKSILQIQKQRCFRLPSPPKVNCQKVQQTKKQTINKNKGSKQVQIVKILPKVETIKRQTRSKIFTLLPKPSKQLNKNKFYPQIHQTKEKKNKKQIEQPKIQVKQDNKPLIKIQSQQTLTNKLMIAFKQTSQMKGEIFTQFMNKLMSINEQSLEKQKQQKNNLNEQSTQLNISLKALNLYPEQINNSLYDMSFSKHQLKQRQYRMQDSIKQSNQLIEQKVNIIEQQSLSIKDSKQEQQFDSMREYRQKQAEYPNFRQQFLAKEKKQLQMRNISLAQKINAQINNDYFYSKSNYFSSFNNITVIDSQDSDEQPKKLNHCYDQNPHDIDSKYDCFQFKQNDYQTLIKHLQIRKDFIRIKSTLLLLNLANKYLDRLTSLVKNELNKNGRKVFLSMKRKQTLMAIFYCEKISLQDIIQYRTIDKMCEFITTYQKDKGTRKKKVQIQYQFIISRMRIYMYTLKYNFQLKQLDQERLRFCLCLLKYYFARERK